MSFVRGPPKTTIFEEAGQRITVHDYGPHVDLLIGQVPIMTSKTIGTEQELGEVSKRLATGPAPKILIGGLGFGITLSSVLKAQGPKAEVLVVEKLRTVIDLVRGPLSHLSPGVLEDPRVTLINDDVRHVMAREQGVDVILLDVDNGPDWASFKSNQQLYGKAGLASAHNALAPGGALAVWSHYPADGFLKVLQRARFQPSVIPLHEHGKVRAFAYVGKKASAQRGSMRT